MRIDIDALTKAELVDLNRRIVERLKFIESMRAHAEMMEFSVGEQVCFHPPGRGEVVGIFVKYNKMTVTVVTEDGYKSNVSPRLLGKAKVSKAKPGKSGKVIEFSPE